MVAGKASDAALKVVGHLVITTPAPLPLSASRQITCCQQAGFYAILKQRKCTGIYLQLLDTQLEVATPQTQYTCRVNFP